MSMRRVWMSWLIGAIFPGAVLLSSAVLKATAPTSMMPPLRFLAVPDGAQKLVILLLIGVEAASGTALLLFGPRALPRAIAAGLLGSFTVILIAFLLSRHPPDCGCMGKIRVFESTRLELLAGLGRNLLLLAGLLWPINRVRSERMAPLESCAPSSMP